MFAAPARKNVNAKTDEGAGVKPVQDHSSFASRAQASFGASGIPLAPPPAPAGGALLLQRKCDSCNSSEEEEKKGPVLQRSPMPGGAARSAAPPIVHNVLNTPGRPLDGETRSFMEPRFGHDLGRVRIHHDAAAAESAKSVNALAYTVGNHVVFGSGKYEPHSLQGRKLMAHELAHTVQQGRMGSSSGGGLKIGRVGDTYERQADTAAEQVSSGKEALGGLGMVAPVTVPLIQRAPESGGDSELWETIFNAIDGRHWEEAARAANQLSPGKLGQLLQMPDFKNPLWVSQLYLGAVSTVGEKSAVANATRYTHLDYNYNNFASRGQWYEAARFLNGFNETDVKKRLAKLATPAIQAIYDGAVRNSELGSGSGAAKFSAQVLAERSAKGDAAAKPVVPADSSPEAMKRKCESGDKSGLKIFPLRMPHGLWRISVAPISAHREGGDILVKQPFNGVFADPMFHNEVKTLPLETFLGGIRLKPHEIVGVRLYDDRNRIACVTGEDMLRISSATDTAIILSIARTALDAATVVVPGASAGLSKLGQAGVAAGLGGTTAAISNLSDQLPLVQAGLQDHIKWGELGFETVFGAVTGALIGPLSERVGGILEGNAFLKPLIQKTPGFVKAFLLDRGLVALHVAAHTVFEKLNGQNVTYDEFIKQLTIELTNPDGLLVFAISHAVSQVGHEAGTGPKDPESGSPPPVERASIRQPSTRKVVPISEARQPVANKLTPRERPVGSLAEARARRQTQGSKAPASEHVTQAQPQVQEQPLKLAAGAERETVANQSPGEGGREPIVASAGKGGTTGPKAASQVGAPKTPGTGSVASLPSKSPSGGKGTGLPAPGSTPAKGVYSARRSSAGEPRVEIKAWIGKGDPRAGLENQMMSGTEYAIKDLADWQRAHSTGPSLGIESGEGIYLAPRVVNLALQNKGVESFLRTLRDTAAGRSLHLEAVTAAHPNTLRLSSIDYKVGVLDGGRIRSLFDVSIEVRTDGTARAGVRAPGSDEVQWGPWVGAKKK